MNYQNNIDAYYAYAKENNKKRRKETKLTWLWLILSIIVLFLVWAYFSNLNLQNLLDSNNKENATNKTISVPVKEVNKTVKTKIEEEKSPLDLVSSNNLNEKNISVAKIMKNIPQENVSTIPEKSLDKNISLDKNSSILLSKITDVNKSSEGNESLPLLKDLDKNSSIEVNGSKLNITSLEQNISVEENTSVELYHVYVVSRGESIYDIARKEYGDTQMYVKIVNANPDLINPNKIREGEELFLPIVNESKSYSDILHFR